MLMIKEHHKEYMKEYKRVIKLASEKKDVGIIVKDPEKVKMGKRNRAAGARFERKVRADLEEKGWMVSKYQNNVEFPCRCLCHVPMSARRKKDFAWGEIVCKHCDSKTTFNCGTFAGESIPAKASRFRLSSTGFPDFIAYRKYDNEIREDHIQMFEYEIQFIEAKTNGYLSKEEKEKARWYLDNNYCSKFLIAKKIKVGRKIEVEYVDFEKKYKK